MEKKKKDWFKLKRYPHIGFPLKSKDRYLWIEEYVTSPDEIQKHAFLPFIHKTSKKRKFRKQYSEDTGKVIIDTKAQKALREPDIKDRELYYASHLDSLIYSYYSEILSKNYEDKIKEYDLEEVVLAYRSIPIKLENPEGPNKCNIDFANDTFNYIRSYPDKEFIAVALDIKGFFDELDHKILRDVWLQLLQTKENIFKKLPPDHFNVYKNITRFTYVDIVDLFKEFQNKIFIQKRDASGKLLPKKRSKVSKIKFLKNQDAVAFCTKKEFYKKKNKLVRNTKLITKGKNKGLPKKFGIPQGSPISSVLANAYLLNFDRTINDFIKKEGTYRRYSDDMVVVCPLNKKDETINLVMSEIKKVKLEIQDSKTQIFHFTRKNGILSCGQQFKNGINENKNLIYLGFEFDGEITLVRSASISAFYRKMKKTVKRSKHYAKKGKNKGQIFKGRILKKFSYKGADRKRKWEWDDLIKGFVKSDSYDWGNFLSYSNKAAKTMTKNKIKKQTKKSWNKLVKEIKK
ncbi:RNA-dependent DNA polymerase [Winogradskyella undariae]|uniref:reverse transcriptase domain-containing protein n=1 Tax=Winogradskyella undariae TaxID=1285465 RepID=UPI00156AEE41|nr:reverse transcriptase domain-containing protein [Winogradskyella undariae]NRR92393.1 RNA-dependent DNA polymerase [Winogradskyella undariae]